MAWESRKGRGRYYTRSRRRGGRVVREYLGAGEMADLASRVAELRRERLAKTAQDRREWKAAVDALDSTVADACEAIDLLAQAALLVAGYRQHHRGEWRRKRHV
jgi:hypothetical protein